METKIRLCDDCKKRIKDINCAICGADVCESCKTYQMIKFESICISQLDVCKSCNGKVTNYFRTTKNSETDLVNAVSNFKPDMIKVLRKLIMIKNLDENTK